MKIKNWVTHGSWGDKAKAAGFALLGLLFVSGVHWGFFRFLKVINNVELVGDLLIMKLLAMALMTAFLMIIFSSTITAFSTLFFSRDLGILIHTPLPYRTVFAYKSLETAIFSSWMMILALAPFLAAFARVMGASAAFYGVTAVLFIPYVMIASSVGILVSLGLMRLFPARRVREAMLVLGVMISTGLFLWVRWLAPTQFLRADAMEFVIQYVTVLKAPTAPYLPSYWLARALSAWTESKPALALAWGGGLILAATTLWAGLLALGQRAYYAGWSSAQESARRGKPRPLGAEWRWVPLVFGPRFRAYLGKDLAIFRRDSNQWSQLLMLVSIVAIYLMSIGKLPLDTPYLRALISFLNIGMVGFVLASVALRFVFPSISLEGKSWWALRGTPLGMWEILWGKFLGGVVPLGVMGVGLVWVSNVMLKVDPFVVTMSNITVGVMAVTLTAMGLGWGAMFPRFGTENVAQIQTSAGGLMFMTISMFYVGATLALEAVIMKAHYFGGLRRGECPTEEVLAGLLAINALALVVPLMVGKRRLERMDV